MLDLAHKPTSRRAPGAANLDFADHCRTLARVLPGVEFIEDSPDAESIGHWIGLDRSAYVAFDARVVDKPTTIICLPMATWHSPEKMEVIMSLKHLLLLLDRRVVLVPERFVRRQPRLDNVTLIAGSSNARLTATERMRVLAVLLEEDTASLTDLASMVSSDDPVSSILRLVHEGCIEIDLNKPIMPTTLIRIAKPRIAQ